MARRQRRGKDGRIKDGVIQRLRSWWLGRKIRKGKLPRGRMITSKEAVAAINGTLHGCMTEIWGLLTARRFRWIDGISIRRKKNLLKKYTFDQLEHLGFGLIIDYGLICTRKVTTAFRDYLVDSLQNSTTSPLDAFRYHGCGTGVTAEVNTQVALVTEVGARVQGTQVEGATPNIYRTVATLTPGGTYAITEHGVFSAAAAGTMMDRSVFAAISVTAVDSIEFTYECTFNAEA